MKIAHSILLIIMKDYVEQMDIFLSQVVSTAL